MKYKITENFLPPNQFRDIQDVFMGMEIPWNCIDGVVMPGDSLDFSSDVQFIFVCCVHFVP